jgi:peptidoglycan/LPS O-acetylase OafA/YrhL
MRPEVMQAPCQPGALRRNARAVEVKPPATSHASQRLAFIDALRGFAALWVLAYHFYEKLYPEPWARLPQPLDWFLGHGHMGVQVFFVISGFVIAHGIASAPMDARAALRFLGRRAIRLNPAYWAVILACVAPMYISFFFGSGQWPPTGGDVILNLLYLDKITGSWSILAVGWTLCLEVQFYVLFVVLLWASQALRKHVSAAAALFVTFVPATVLSLALKPKLLGLEPQAWLFSYWHMFMAGAVVWLVTHTSRARPLLFALLAVQAVFAIERSSPSMGTVALTGALIAWVAHRGALGSALRGPLLQYFGRISYSLYLVHALVGNTIIQAAHRMTDLETSWVLRLGAAAAAVAASVLVAHGLHVLVEVPTQRLSKRLAPASRARRIDAAPSVAREAA